MPPKPPFDITTIRSPSRASRRHGVDDRVDVRQMPRVHVLRASRSATSFDFRQPLVLGQARSEHRRDHHLVGAGKRAREVVLEHPPARRRRPRLEDRPDALARRRAPHRLQRLGDRRRMMREVVVDGDAARSPTTSSRRFTPLKCRQARAQSLDVEAQVDADGDRRQRVAHVVIAEQRHRELAEIRRRRAARGTSCRSPTRDVGRAPVGVARQGRTSARGCARAAASAAASGLSAPSSVRPLRGTRFTRRRNASRTSSMSAIDVGVIELDVVDDGDVGQVLQELRGLVEVGAVVLVALDDERRARCRSR